MKKLNELVNHCNYLSKALKESFSKVQEGVQTSIVANLSAFVEQVKLQVKGVADQLSELIEKPSVSSEGIAAEVNDKVLGVVREEMKLFKEEMMEMVRSEFAKAIPSGIDQNLTRITSEIVGLKSAVTNLQKDVQSQTFKVSEVATKLQEIPSASSEPSFTNKDRETLNHLRTSVDEHQTKLVRMKTAFQLMTSALTKSVSTHDWGHLKGFQALMDDYSLDGAPKGERVSQRLVTPMIASSAELIEATKRTESEVAASIEGEQPEGERDLANGKNVESGSEKGKTKESEKDLDKWENVPDDVFKSLATKQRLLGYKIKQRMADAKRRIAQNSYTDGGAIYNAAMLNLSVD